MRILLYLYWSIIIVLAPSLASALTISAFSQLQEHIQVLNMTDYSEASSGTVSSFVRSESAPEHYLQGNTSASASADGTLSVSAIGLVDCYDGVETYFSSVATWTESFINDDESKHYFFDFNISDINIGSDYRTSSNRTGYEFDVFLNGNLLYSQSYIFDTESLYNEYYQSMMNGDPDPPPGEYYFTIAEEQGLIDLGYFDLNENFSLKYQISAFAQPLDISSCFTNFSVTGHISSWATPVPEPSTAGLLITGCLVGAIVLGLRSKVGKNTGKICS